MVLSSKNLFFVALALGMCLSFDARTQSFADDMVLKGMADGGEVPLLEDEEADDSFGTSGAVLTDDGQAVWQGGENGASLSQFPAPATTSKSGSLGSYLSSATSTTTGVMKKSSSSDDTALIEQIGSAQEEETHELGEVIKKVEQNSSDNQDLIYSH